MTFWTLEESASLPLQLGPNACSAGETRAVGTKLWHLTADRLPSGAIRLSLKSKVLEVWPSSGAEICICSLKRAKGPGWVALCMRRAGAQLETLLEGKESNDAALEWLLSHREVLGEVFESPVTVEDWGYDC